MKPADRVPYDDPRWHPSMMRDVVVHVRSHPQGGGAAAVLTATPPTIPAIEGRRRDAAALDPAMLSMGLLRQWVEQLEEPMCIVLDFDNETAMNVLLLDDSSRPDLRPWAVRFRGECSLAGHDFRRLGASRPVLETYSSAHVEEDGMFVVDESKPGDA